MHEVRGDDCEELAKTLAQLLRADLTELQGLQVIVSSRIHGYEGDLLKIERDAYLVPFQETEVEIFIRQFSQMSAALTEARMDAAEIVKELRKRPGVLVSCANLLVVTLLCRMCQLRSLPQSEKPQAGRGQAGKRPAIRVVLEQEVDPPDGGGEADK